MDEGGMWKISAIGEDNFYLISSEEYFDKCDDEIQY